MPEAATAASRNKDLREKRRWISDRVRPYLIALAAMAIATALAYLFIHAGTGLPARRFAGGALLIFYIVVVMGSAWLGFGPGILVCGLSTFVAPRLVFSNPRFWQVDLLHFSELLLISLLISWIARSHRRREADLVRAAHDLELRVQQRTEEAVRAAEAMRVAANEAREQAQLLDLAHDAILSLDQNATIRFWNSGAAEMYGWPREEAIGKISHDLLQTKFPEPFPAILEKLAAKGHWEGELTHTRRDATQLIVSSRWALKRSEDGAAHGFLEINTDITGKRRIEEQLRHTQKLESLGVLAGGVAHDFNNLLTGILGNSSLALDTVPAHDPNRVLIEEVMKAAERAADLTRQLLAYAGKGRFVMRTVDLSSMVREIGGLVQTSIPKHVQLRLQLPDGLPGVDADSGQIQQVIMNLVINGAEAIGPQGGSVIVNTGTVDLDENYIASLSPAGELLKPGRYVALEVHDTGGGMSKETLAKIFDPFFTTKFAGRGLGLSAVLGIVRAHNGALKVYSEQGQGTTFKVLFPSSSRAVAPPAETVAGNLSGKGTILIVDDDEIVRTIAAHALERYGYATVIADNGAAALDVFRQRRGAVILVLLDLTMPVMGGEETLRQLRMADPNVRVLLTSGYNELEAVRRFAGKGLAGFIQKPYTAAALAGKVKEVLAKHRTASHSHAG